MYEYGVCLFVLLLWSRFNWTDTESVAPVDNLDSYLEKWPTCGRDTGSDRIVGGNVTGLDEFTWLVLLFYQNRSQQISYDCGGSLINRRYVLTAAHCLTGSIIKNKGKLTFVRLGEYDTTQKVDCRNGKCADPPQDIPVQASYPHPGYSKHNKNSADDIGLVRLSLRANYNRYVMPICLVTYKGAKYLPGTYVSVAGWGRDDYGDQSQLKLKVAIPIYDKSNCTDHYMKTLHIHLDDKQLCVGGEFMKDACNGDSGGSAVRISRKSIWEAIAIVSLGRGCGADNRPALYTLVESYIDWIQSTMKKTNV